MAEEPPTSNAAVPLEPIGPATAQQLYLDHKASEYAEKTVKAHRYRTNHFVRWCAQEDIENLNNLSGRDLHQYKLWRKEDGNLNKVSLTTQMSTIRVFFIWAASIDAVDPNLYKRVPGIEFSDEFSVVGKWPCGGVIGRLDWKVVCESCGRWVPIEVWDAWTAANSDDSHEGLPSESDSESDGSEKRSLGDYL